jgi:pimeloyl-[acyl-carrier protein] methyl ester esterase
MSLYIERQGRGPRIVLIHGWGLHGGVFEDLAARLARDHEVIVPDLPGHGRSPAGELAPEVVSRELLERVGGDAVWLGWSLGGLVALTAARQFPAQVARLVLVGATPKFVQGPDWTAGMSETTFAEFTGSLFKDYRTTLLRFLSLQAGRDDAGREVLRSLRARVFAHGEPGVAALEAGLQVLAAADVRAVLKDIAVPALVIQGEYDRLSVPAAAEFMARALPQARLVTVAGAGHAPFLSHPQQLEDEVRKFLA